MVDDLKKVTPLLIAWLGASITLYLYIYWSRFDVDPFAYISLSEVLNYTGPYFFVAAAIAIVIGISEFIIPNRKHSKSIGDDVTPIRVVIAVAISEGFISIYFRDKWPPLNFFYYSTVFVLAAWIARSELVYKYISNHAIRITCLIFVFVSPYAAIYSAIDGSENVLKEVSSKRVYVHGAEMRADKPFIYVGRLGGYTFLKEIGSYRMYQIRSDDIQYFEYVLNKKSYKKSFKRTALRAAA